MALFSKWMGFSTRSFPPPPSLRRMGFASRGSPSLSPRGSLLQVDEILLKGLPSPQRMGFVSKDSPSQQRMGFASSGSLSPREWDSHQEGHPLQSDGIRIKRVTLSKANEIRTKESPSPSEWDSHQEGHPLQSKWDSLLTSGLVAARDPFQGILLQGHATQGIPFSKGLRLCVSANGIRFKRFSFSQTTTFESGDSDSPRRRIHSELRLVSLQLRDPIRGLLPPILIHLFDKIWKLKTPLFQAQLRP